MPKRKANSDNSDDFDTLLSTEVPTKAPKSKKMKTKAADEAEAQAQPKTTKRSKKSEKPKQEKPKRFAGQKKVEDLMRSAGLDPEELKDRGNCYKAALARGKMEFSGKPEDLDKVIAETECCSDGCDGGGKMIVTARTLFNQRDYGGYDYDEGSEGGAGVCQICGAHQYYGGLCQGKPTWDSGKFTTHCTLCPGYGKCIGDYRMHHCERCNKHTWVGAGGSIPCEYCHPSGMCTDEEYELAEAMEDELAQAQTSPSSTSTSAFLNPNVAGGLHNRQWWSKF